MVSETEIATIINLTNKITDGLGISGNPESKARIAAAVIAIAGMVSITDVGPAIDRLASVLERKNLS